MTLEQDGDHVRLVECPFCSADLRRGDPARHLAECEDAEEQLLDDEPHGQRGGA